MEKITDENKRIIGYETYSLERTNEPNVKFVGILLGESKGFVADEETDYTFKLYKTKSNKYICYSICERPHTTTYHVRVETEINEVIDFFEQSNVAHKLYALANIDNYNFID